MVEIVSSTLQAGSRQSADERLRKLAQLSLTLTGDPASIFKRVARMIGELLDVRVVCLSEIRGDELFFISVYVDGKVMQDAGRCPLKITPCATVESSKDLRTYEKVMELFPEASFLKEHDAYSYCGFPALGADGEVVAVTCLLDDKPHEFTPEDQDLLRIFGQRIAFEIERQREQQARRDTEQAMLLREQHFRHLVETAHAVPWTFDMRTMCFTYVGPQAETMLGYPVADWFTEDFWAKHIHAEDRDWAVNFCMTSAARCEDHDFEYRMIAADGRSVWIRDSVNVLADEHGPYEMQGFMFDVTERKEVELALNMLAEIDASNDPAEFYRTCVSSLARVYGARYAFVGLLADDTCSSVETQAVWAGDSFADNFHYDLAGTPCNDVLTCTKSLIPRDVIKHYPDDHLLAEMGAESYFGAPLITSDGETIGIVAILDVEPMKLSRWVEPVLGIFTQRITNEIERHQVLDNLEQTVAQRTSDLEQAKEAAVAANRAKTEFLSRMSHELRTPLNAVLGFAQILDMELEDGDEKKNHAREIYTAGDHLLTLIEEVMDLSRIETNQIVVKPESIRLDAVIREAVAYIRPQAAQRGITVEVSDVIDCVVYADLTRVKEILLNLLSNAVKYNKDNGSIRISCGQQDGYIKISVRDTGIGFNEEQKNMLFEPFSRLGAEYTGIEGTGIGMTIVKRLVELMGGQILVESKVGEGSCFDVLLPRGL